MPHGRTLIDRKVIAGNFTVTSDEKKKERKKKKEKKKEKRKLW